MGTYDTLEGKCPHCEARYHCQTKRFDCDLNTLHPGSRIPGAETFTGSWVLKSPCTHCSKDVVAVVNSGVLYGFMTVAQAKPSHIEVSFGGVKLYRPGEPA